MKSLLLFLVIIVSNTFYVKGQTTDSPIFSSVQKLVDKAKGKKLMGLTGNYNKIGKQIFSYNLVSVELKGQGKYSSVWLYNYSKINWKSLNYYLWPVNGNDKLMELHIKLTEDCILNKHVKGEIGSDDRETSLISLYFLSKDYDAMKNLLEEQWK